MRPDSWPPHSEEVHGKGGYRLKVLQNMTTDPFSFLSSESLEPACDPQKFPDPRSAALGR